MYAIYAYIGVVWGVNVGIYMAHMECLGSCPAIVVKVRGRWFQPAHLARLSWPMEMQITDRDQEPPESTSVDGWVEAN